ncbi:hypothetical protein NL676_026104 [Syzygium grande]|nr:hypothetical protein NL676_026104 [Syzygium grande]
MANPSNGNRDVNQLLLQESPANSDLRQRLEDKSMTARVWIETRRYGSYGLGNQLGMASAVETPCGRAFGAKRYHMLGIYAQRSWIVLLLCCLLSLPLYIFVTPLPKLLSQFNDESALSGTMALWFIPVRFSFTFMFPLSKFLQSNLKTVVTTLGLGPR